MSHQTGEGRCHWRLGGHRSDQFPSQNVKGPHYKVLGVTGLFGLVKCQKGQNTCLRAISINDVSRTNQPARKILHVRIGGNLRVSLPNAVRLVVARQR